MLKPAHARRLQTLPIIALYATFASPRCILLVSILLLIIVSGISCSILSSKLGIAVHAAAREIPRIKMSTMQCRVQRKLLEGGDCDILRVLTVFRNREVGGIGVRSKVLAHGPQHEYAQN